MTQPNPAAPAVPVLTRSLFKTDHPRAIDRLIDFFGERRLGERRPVEVPAATSLASRRGEHPA